MRHLGASFPLLCRKLIALTVKALGRFCCVLEFYTRFDYKSSGRVELFAEVLLKIVTTLI